jgi:hypothetical protein
MPAGWIPTLNRLAVRTNAYALDPFWFALESIALAKNCNFPFKLKTSGFTCHFS